MFDMTRMRRRVGGIFVCAAAASLGPSPRMTWRSWWSGLKALFSIAPLLFVVTPSIAADVTYKDYTNASSEIWKRGFVLGISQYMAAVAQPDEEAPIPRCIAPPPSAAAGNACTNWLSGRGEISLAVPLCRPRHRATPDDGQGRTPMAWGCGAQPIGGSDQTSASGTREI